MNGRVGEGEGEGERERDSDLVRYIEACGIVPLF